MFVVSVSYMRFQSMISYHCVWLSKTGINVIIIVITHQNIICAAITLKNNTNLHSRFVSRTCCFQQQYQSDHKSKSENNSYRHDVGFRFFLIFFTRCLSLNRHWSRISCSLAPTHTHAYSKCIFLMHKIRKTQLPSTSLLLMQLRAGDVRDSVSGASRFLLHNRLHAM